MSEMKSLTKDELKSLLEVASQHSKRDWLMLLVTFNHGLRVSETLSLTSKNIVSGHLVIQRLKGSRKTTQPMLQNEYEGLLEMCAFVEGRFFQMCRKTFWERMKFYGALAGIPEFKRHPHALKHTCGKLMADADMKVNEIQKRLGHKNGANAMIYMDADEEQVSKAFAASVSI